MIEQEIEASEQTYESIFVLHTHARASFCLKTESTVDDNSSQVGKLGCIVDTLVYDHEFHWTQ